MSISILELILCAARQVERGLRDPVMPPQPLGQFSGDFWRAGSSSSVIGPTSPDNLRQVNQ